MSTAHTALDRFARIASEHNSHAANEAYKQSLFTLLDALYVSPDLPMADVLAKLARLEARNAKRAQDNAGLVAALESFLFWNDAAEDGVLTELEDGSLVTRKELALVGLRAVLAAAKE